MSRRGLGEQVLALWRLFCLLRTMFSAGRGMRQKQRYLLLTISHSLSLQFQKSRIYWYFSLEEEERASQTGTSRCRLPMYPWNMRPLPVERGQTTKDWSKLIMLSRLSLTLAFRILNNCYENFSSILVALLARISFSSALVIATPSYILPITLTVDLLGLISSGSYLYQQSGLSFLLKSAAIPISSGLILTPRTQSVVTANTASNYTPFFLSRKTSCLILVVLVSTPSSERGMMHSFKFSSRRALFSPISMQSQSTSPLESLFSCWLYTNSFIISQLSEGEQQYKNMVFSCQRRSQKAYSCCRRGAGEEEGLLEERFLASLGDPGRANDPVITYLCSVCSGLSRQPVMYRSTSSATSTREKD